MRSCVFVDGENFRKSIVGLYPKDFKEHDYLPHEANWATLFDYLVAEATEGEGKRVRTYWYVIDNVAPYPRINEATPNKYKLEQEAEKIKKRFAGFKVVQNGIAHKHKAIEFRRSGEIGYNLETHQLRAEKTVDVNLAIDMLQLRDNYDVAVIVSGDQDYVPAVQAIKNMGKHVVNVSFKKRNGDLLPGGARTLNQATDWSYAVDWEKLKGFLNI